jgi:hypothetical protein
MSAYIAALSLTAPPSEPLIRDDIALQAVGIGMAPLANPHVVVDKTVPGPRMNADKTSLTQQSGDSSIDSSLGEYSTAPSTFHSQLVPPGSLAGDDEKLGLGEALLEMNRPRDEDRSATIVRLRQEVARLQGAITSMDQSLVERAQLADRNAEELDRVLELLVDDFDEYSLKMKHEQDTERALLKQREALLEQEVAHLTENADAGNQTRRELEDRLGDLSARYHALSQEYNALADEYRQQVRELEKTIESQKGMATTLEQELTCRIAQHVVENQTQTETVNELRLEVSSLQKMLATQDDSLRELTRHAESRLALLSSELERLFADFELFIRGTDSQHNAILITSREREATLSKRIDDLKSAAGTQDKLREQLLSQLNEVKLQRNNLQVEYETLQTTYISKAQDFADTISAEKRKRRELEERAHAKQREVAEDFSDQIEQFCVSVDQLQAEVQSLQHDLNVERTTAHVKAAQQEQIYRQQELELRQKLDRLSNAYQEDKFAAHTRYQTTLDSYKKREESLQSKADRLSSQLGDETARVEQYRFQMEQLRTEKDDVEQKLANITENISRAISEKTAFYSRQVEDMRLAMQSSTSEFSAKVCGLEAELASLTRNMTARELEYQLVISERNAKLIERENILQVQIKRLTEEYQDYKKKSLARESQIASELSSQKNAFAALSKRWEVQVAESSCLANQHMELGQELSSLKSDFQALQQKLISTTAGYDQLIDKNTKLHLDEKTELTSRISKDQVEKEALSSKIFDLAKTVNVLTEARIAAEQQCARIQTQYDEAVHALATQAESNKVALAEQSRNAHDSLQTLSVDFNRTITCLEAQIQSLELESQSSRQRFKEQLMQNAADATKAEEKLRAEVSRVTLLHQQLSRDTENERKQIVGKAETLRLELRDKIYCLESELANMTIRLGEEVNRTVCLEFRERDLERDLLLLRNKHDDLVASLDDSNRRRVDSEQASRVASANQRNEFQERLSERDSQLFNLQHDLDLARKTNEASAERISQLESEQADLRSLLKSAGRAMRKKADTTAYSFRSLSSARINLFRSSNVAGIGSSDVHGEVKGGTWSDAEPGTAPPHYGSTSQGRMIDDGQDMAQKAGSPSPRLWSRVKEGGTRVAENISKVSKKFFAITSFAASPAATPSLGTTANGPNAPSDQQLDGPSLSDYADGNPFGSMWGSLHTNPTSEDGGEFFKFAGRPIREERPDNLPSFRP